MKLGKKNPSKDEQGFRWNKLFQSNQTKSIFQELLFVSLILIKGNEYFREALMLTFQLNSFNITIFWYLSTFTLHSCFPAQHLSPTHPSPVSLSCVALLTLLIGCGFIRRPVEQSNLALTANLSGVLSDEAVWSGRDPVCYVCIS